MPIPALRPLLRARSTGPSEITITVIMTTRNRPAYLRKVLEGYLQQTRLPEELVVADDGSGPETRQQVDAFRARAPFPVIHAWQEHHGVRLSHLRNLATRESTGDYILYTDGDCVPGPHFVSDHERVAARGWFVRGRRTRVLFSGFDEFTGQESLGQIVRLWLSGKVKKWTRSIRIPEVWKEEQGLQRIEGCNIAAFREDILRINGWNEDFVGFWKQDKEFCLRLMRAGVRRRDAIYSAVLYHLEHEKVVNLQDQERNNRLMKQAYTAPIFTPHGIYPVGEKCRRLRCLPNGWQVRRTLVGG